MTLESLESYFNARRGNETMRKAGQAYQLTKAVEELIGEKLRIIVHRVSLTIECPNSALAAKLNLQRRALNEIVIRILGEPRKLRIVAR